MDFGDITEHVLKLADRVVEIRDASTDDEHSEDYTLFPNLKRLTLVGVPKDLTWPTHKLECLKVLFLVYNDQTLSRIPSDCAEQITAVFQTEKSFLKAKEQSLPPNVHVFCSPSARASPPPITSTGGR